MLVGVEHRYTLLSLHLDRHDLAPESALLCRRRRTAMALHRELVLLFACDTPLGRNVLGGHAHVNHVKRIV